MISGILGALLLAATLGEEQPLAGLDSGPGWYAAIETSQGTIVVRLLPEQAPQAVAHFVALAEGRLGWVDAATGETKQGRYYDGLTVHHVEAAQRFEAGDPTGTGRGAPALYVPLEGLSPLNFNRPGRVGLTRSSLDRISAAQFFVTATAHPRINGRFPCFGEVVAGMDVVARICGVKTLPSGKPLEPITITTVRIHRVGAPPALAEPIPFKPTPPALAPKRPETRG